jgi:GNAT superfamily N-acetyltransferase
MAATIHMANIGDIETLVELRFAYFDAEKIKLTAENKREITAQLSDYFKNHLNIDFFAILVEVGGELAATAFLAIAEKPANPRFPTGRTGTILNVLTLSPYRRQGCATKAMQRLIAIAKNQNLSLLELSASKYGRPLYQKLGFLEKTCVRPEMTDMTLSLRPRDQKKESETNERT